MPMESIIIYDADDKRFVQIKARKVFFAIDGFEGVPFYVHPSYKAKLYHSVTCPKTGMKLGTGLTEERALYAAGLLLEDRGRKAYDRAVDAQIKKFGEPKLNEDTTDCHG